MLDREPFLPFRLVMTSGKAYEVVSPNSAALLKSEVFGDCSITGANC